MKTFQTIQTFQTSQTSQTLRKGFTILELLVASLLLSMLVTMLTMIFNQSSIAWRTGVASVSELGETRKQMGGYHDITDDLLPGVGQQNAQTGSSDNRELKYRTVSLFRNWSGSGQINVSDVSKNCSGRLVDDARNQLSLAGLSGALPTAVNGDVQQGKVCENLTQPQNGRSNSGYIVGVRSAGPDGDMSTEDDNIDTFPEDVD